MESRRGIVSPHRRLVEVAVMEKQMRGGNWQRFSPWMSWRNPIRPCARIRTVVLSRAVSGCRLRVRCHGTHVSIVRQRKWICSVRILYRVICILILWLMSSLLSLPSSFLIAQWLRWMARRTPSRSHDEGTSSAHYREVLKSWRESETLVWRTNMNTKKIGWPFITTNMHGRIVHYTQQRHEHYF